MQLAMAEICDRETYRQAELAQTKIKTILTYVAGHTLEKLKYRKRVFSNSIYLVFGYKIKDFPLYDVNPSAPDKKGLLG